MLTYYEKFAAAYSSEVESAPEQRHVWWDDWQPLLLGAHPR
jgi:hypothetical protein